MAAQTGLYVQQMPEPDGSGATAKGSRLAIAGLIAKNSDGTVRVGVLADGQGPVVTGNAGMTYTIRKHVAVTKTSEANGPTLVPNDGNVTVTTDPAPGSNSRIDIIWVQQRHLAVDGGSDVVNTPLFGVAKGAVSATPSAPTGLMPTGALELARTTVAAGTVATSGLTITQGPMTWVGDNVVRAFTRADTTAAYANGGTIGTMTFPAIPVASRVIVDMQGVCGFVAGATQIVRVGFAVNAGTLTDPGTQDTNTSSVGGTWMPLAKMAWVDIPANTAVTLTSTMFTTQAGGAWWGGVTRGQRYLPGEYA